MHAFVIEKHENDYLLSIISNSSGSFICCSYLTISSSNYYWLCDYDNYYVAFAAGYFFYFDCSGCILRLCMSESILF